MSLKGAAPKKEEKGSHRHHHRHRRHEKDQEAKDVQAKKEKKQKHGHHSHKKEAKKDKEVASNATSIQPPKLPAPVQPASTDAAKAEVAPAKELKDRAVAAVSALEALKSEEGAHLDFQHSATIEKLIANDAHAQTALKIFEHANNKAGLEVKEAQGEDTRHMGDQLLPERHGMVIDDVTKQWRIRTTEEEIAFQEAQKKEAQSKTKPSK